MEEPQENDSPCVQTTRAQPFREHPGSQRDERGSNHQERPQIQGSGGEPQPRHNLQGRGGKRGRSDHDSGRPLKQLKAFVL